MSVIIFHPYCPTLYLIQQIAIDGKALTIISSDGGEAFTLATSGAGVVTSVLGSIYTVATAAIGSEISKLASPSSSSSAFVPYAGVQTSLLVALGSMLVSALLGMMITLWSISEFQVVVLIKLEEEDIVLLVVGSYMIIHPGSYSYAWNLELELTWLIINVGRKLALKRLANRDHRIIHCTWAEGAEPGSDFGKPKAAP
jgi:hypothetical protein